MSGERERVRIEWMGERHIRVTVAQGVSSEGHARVQSAVHGLRAAGLSWIADLTPAYASVLIRVRDGVPCAAASERAILEEQLRGALLGATGSAPEETGEHPRRRVEIPVCYEGGCAPDLAETARACGLTASEVISLHSGAAYAVAFVGFSPGFAYLLGLPRALNTERLATPRARVPAGSVAIAGDQAGVYPQETPGGWRLIGRTPLRLFDAARAEPCLLKMGDDVRFVPISAAEFHRLCALPQEEGGKGQTRERRAGGPVRARIRIIDPGLYTTVQDLGRPGMSAMGVSVGGAADSWSLRAGNRLVGNDDGAAALETMLSGCSLAADSETVVVVTGARALVTVHDGRADLPGRAAVLWTPMVLRAGHVLRVHPVGSGGESERGVQESHGARNYICFAGGLLVPRVLGSASTNGAAGFGGHMGRSLIRGDELEVGAPLASGRDVNAAGVDPAAAAGVWAGRGGRARTVRAIAAPAEDERQATAQSALWRSRFRVGVRSNRAGIRLEGAPIAEAESGRMTSEGMAHGFVQLPPDGDPIVLMNDHPTTGGYPVIACVVEADLPALGQLRPGDEVRFEEVNAMRAMALREERERALDTLVKTRADDSERLRQAGG